MINRFFKKLKLVLQDPNLTRRILVVLGALVIFRLLAAIPVPGVDQNALTTFFNNNNLLGLVNISSGGGLSSFSVVMLGVGPYITASIIMQVMTMLVPQLKSMSHEEGEAGKKKFAQISRTVAIPIAVIQAFSFILLLQQQGIIQGMNSADMMTNIIVITAGSMLLMWIGELMTEFGIGNGVSLIIFAGIVAGLPGAIQNLYLTYDPSQLPAIIAFVVIGLGVVAFTVFITEAERPVPITYAKQARGSAHGGTSTYLPLRLNQAGVIPIIFALSIMLIPNMVAGLLSASSNLSFQIVAGNINAFMSNQLYYGIIYFVLVFLLTYFYTAVTFDPEEIATNLQKSGAFIPGVRPGEQTAKHLGDTLTRITFVGALFLGSVAVLPIIVQYYSGINSITVGGTALLIAVSVAIDLVKKIDSQVSMREY
jgi:preprotein translocase subunit SecY